MPIYEYWYCSKIMSKILNYKLILSILVAAILALGLIFLITPQITKAQSSQLPALKFTSVGTNCVAGTPTSQGTITANQSSSAYACLDYANFIPSSSVFPFVFVWDIDNQIFEQNLPGTVSSGIYQISTNLLPGNYGIGGFWYNGDIININQAISFSNVVIGGTVGNVVGMMNALANQYGDSNAGLPIGTTYFRVVGSFPVQPVLLSRADIDSVALSSRELAADLDRITGSVRFYSSGDHGVIDEILTYFGFSKAAAGGVESFQNAVGFPSEEADNIPGQGTRGAFEAVLNLVDKAFDSLSLPVGATRFYMGWNDGSYSRYDPDIQSWESYFPSAN